MTGLSASEIIQRFDLQPHPEGGHYRQTWIDHAESGRPAGTCIYFLLQKGERSHWHKVDAAEIWHFYAGAPLLLHLSETDDGPARTEVLSPDLLKGHVPQIIVPKDHWQAAETTGDYTLVGCTVSPAFRFEGFTLAPNDFDIPKA